MKTHQTRSPPGEGGSFSTRFVDIELRFHRFRVLYIIYICLSVCRFVKVGTTSVNPTLSQINNDLLKASDCAETLHIVLSCPSRKAFI